LVKSPAEEGRDAYLAMCATCHGVNAKGDGPAGAALRTPPPDLTRFAERHGTFPQDLIVDIVTGRYTITAHGTREMPVWNARLTERGAVASPLYSALFRDRLNTLVEYLQSIQVRSGSRAGT
jgi:mono/diheme cytochrome c family protein